MKKGLVFLLGMITGAALLLVIGYFLGVTAANNSPLNDPGISLFYESGQTLQLKSFEIFQVLPNGSALAKSTDKEKGQPFAGIYGDPIVLFLPDEGVAYYDDMVIDVPKDKIVRQIGTYRYETKRDFVKTVPIVKFFDK